MKTASSDGKEHARVLRAVLTHLKPISEAPNSFADFPELNHLPRDADVSGLQARLKAKDAETLYKGIDQDGNVYEMHNPWSTAKRYLDEQGRSYVRYLPRKLLLTWEEAKKASKSVTTTELAQQEERI